MRMQIWTKIVIKKERLEMTKTMILKTMEKSRLTVKVQTLSTIAAIVGAVAVPQIFHVLGAALGLGTTLGESFLPMHLPILLVGLLAGPYAGAVAGMFGPLVSFAFSGMPGSAMLPFMMLELCMYGLAAGWFRNVKLPVIMKVLSAQTAGRVIRLVAVWFAIYGLGSDSVPLTSIWMSIGTGIYGIVLQWVLLPVIVHFMERMKNEEL